VAPALKIVECESRGKKMPPLQFILQIAAN